MQPLRTKLEAIARKARDRAPAVARPFLQKNNVLFARALGGSAE